MLTADFYVISFFDSIKRRPLSSFIIEVYIFFDYIDKLSLFMLRIKILGAVLELPAKQHCQSSPFTAKMGQMG